jgi:sugar/nucleoside kinase (ribokinase family)
MELKSTGVLTQGLGSDAGLRTGDQLLLIDESRIPSRVLEPGALADLSLVEVVAVEADQATLEYRAGAPISDATGKVALPF